MSSASVADERPDAFVGSAVGASPYAPPSLFIKGPADAYVQDLVASAPVTIEIVDNQPYSSDELASRRHRVHSSLLNAGYVHVATRANVLNGGALEVHVGRDADGPVPERDDILALLPAELRDDVAIEMVDHPMNVAEAAFGGMSATRGTDGLLYVWVVRGAHLDRRDRMDYRRTLHRSAGGGWDQASG